MGPILGAAHVVAAFVATVAGQASQEAPASVPPPAAEVVQQSSPAPSPLRIPAATVVDIELMEPLSSKTAKIDATFPIRVALPVVVDGRELIPAGTTGMGQVIHAAKSGGGGKAGELLLAARYLDINGVRVPLRRFRMGTSGAQKADEAFAVGFVVPFGQLLVKGKEIEFQAGTRANAIVAADTELSGPPPGASGAAPSNP
ncbi:hypothetical protein [Sphingomonas koreensis]